MMDKRKISSIDNNITDDVSESILDRIMMFVQSSETNTILATVILGVLVMAILSFSYTKFTGSSNSSSPSVGDSKTKSSSNRNDSSSSRKVKNIWEAGKSSSSTSNDKKTYEDKPFGSKYYYAHNNSNATGGYTDGLKMEDYRMNGPRLLSKNGKTVDDDDTNPDDEQSAGDNEQQEQVPASSTSSSKTKITSTDPNVLNITKYLWDDPGDAVKGIATIRIDSLPTSVAGNFIDWKDIGQPQSIEAKLVGEGLLVKIDTDNHGTYQLKIPKLYGDANDVSYIVKPKRLMIKITKKKIGTVSKNKNNLDAWPQPYRKI